MSGKSSLKLIAAALMAALAVMALVGCITIQTGGTSSSESASADSSSASSSSDSDDSSSSSSSASSASSSASSSSATSSSASSSATSGKTQKIGNKKVGYVEVPSSWVDKTSDLDERIVESYSAVYYADPSSNYSSTALGHDNYAKCIQLTVANTSYTEIAQGIVDGFKADTSKFGTTESGEIQMTNGRKAILITSSLKADGLQLATIVIDRDGDGHSAVALTMNCGKDQTDAEEVLEAAASWTI